MGKRLILTDDFIKAGDCFSGVYEAAHRLKSKSTELTAALLRKLKNERRRVLFAAELDGDCEHAMYGHGLLNGIGCGDYGNTYGRGSGHCEFPFHPGINHYAGPSSYGDGFLSDAGNGFGAGNGAYGEVGPGGNGGYLS